MQQTVLDISASETPVRGQWQLAQQKRQTATQKKHKQILDFSLKPRRYEMVEFRPLNPKRRSKTGWEPPLAARVGKNTGVPRWARKTTRPCAVSPGGNLDQNGGGPAECPSGNRLASTPEQSLHAKPSDTLNPKPKTLNPKLWGWVGRPGHRLQPSCPYKKKVCGWDCAGGFPFSFVGPSLFLAGPAAQDRRRLYINIWGADVLS